MNAVRLLADLRPHGIVLWAENGKLKWQAPKGTLTAADRAELVAHKPELIALLSSPDQLADFEALLFDAAALREWIPTLAWSDVPPGGTVPLWCEEWEQPDGTSWAHAPCLKLEDDLATEEQADPLVLPVETNAFHTEKVAEADPPLVLPVGYVQEGAFIVALAPELGRHEL